MSLSDPIEQDASSADPLDGNSRAGRRQAQAAAAGALLPAASSGSGSGSGRPGNTASAFSRRFAIVPTHAGSCTNAVSPIAAGASLMREAQAAPVAPWTLNPALLNALAHANARLAHLLNSTTTACLAGSERTTAVTASSRSFLASPI